MSESVVLCEGYLDRAFWAGWLEHLGCPKPKPGAVVRDPNKKRVAKGQFGYYSDSDRFIRIVPCHGDSAKILPQIRRRLDGRHIDPIARLVTCTDPDTSPDSGAETGLRVEDLLREVRAFDQEASENSVGDIELDGGKTVVSLVRWETGEGEADGIPAQQCLERLVCAAIVTVYPERGAAVHEWLASRPDPSNSDPKAHAWSYMAGWKASLGCEAFYHTLWDDPRLAKELASRLTSLGAWRIAAALLE